jgi:hypothetical protein
LGNEIQDSSSRYQGAFAPFPWIELTLIFVSTTVATTMLNKLGEDIYNLIKSKATGVVWHKASRQGAGETRQ